MLWTVQELIATAQGAAYVGRNCDERGHGSVFLHEPHNHTRWMPARLSVRRALTGTRSPPQSHLGRPWTAGVNALSNEATSSRSRNMQIGPFLAASLAPKTIQGSSVPSPSRKLTISAVVVKSDETVPLSNQALIAVP